MSVIAFALWGLFQTASAADVVWVGTPPEDAAALLETAGGEAIKPVDLVDGLFGAREADAKAIDGVRMVLESVRKYETEFDGEMIIIQDLTKPIASVGFVASEDEAKVLHAALAYQGFAIDRYFADRLATDETAADYRIELDGTVYGKPWIDAVAMRPDHEITAYEIAEAPQRVNYGKAKAAVQAVLPSALTVNGLPENATLMVNGREAELGASGNLRLAPGRYLVHAKTAGGKALGRWDVRLEPGGSTEIAPVWSAAQAKSDIEALTPGTAPSELLGKAVAAMGGELYVGRVTGDGTVVVKVTPETVETASLQPKTVATTPTPSANTADTNSGPGLLIGAGAGWFYAGDWYLQNPSLPRETGTVNALAVDGTVLATWKSGMFRAGAGADLAITLGPEKEIRFGEGETRFRATPLVAVGIPWVMVTGGFQFPHHPVVGGRAQVPVSGGLSLIASGQVGIPMTWSRSDGTEWTSDETYHVWGGIGYQFGAH